VAEADQLSVPSAPAAKRSPGGVPGGRKPHREDGERDGKMIARSGIVALLAVMLLAPPASAWDHERNGFFLGFGLGAGGSREEYSLDTVSEGGLSGNFRIGGALNRSVALGLETSGFTRREDVPAGDDLTVSASVATFAATWFPTQDGLYLRGGVGFAVASVEFRSGSLRLKAEEGGLGVLGAVGHEFRLTRKFSLAPQFQYAYAGLDSDDLESVGWWSLTAQMTWWW
jgi:hypothetical protein